METVIHNICDLNGNERSAAEQLVGHVLGENQQLVIQIVNVGEASRETEPSSSKPIAVPAWWNIYEGLSEDRIEELDQAIRL